ncbi:MAG: hypothetical protein ABSC89_05405 [Verrucomicrobiota bacterium]
MKRLLNVACLSFVIGACGLTSALAKDAPNSAGQLRSELESALEAKDTNAIMSLFNSEGGTNDWRESAGMREMMITFQTRAMLQTNVTGVRLLPLPADFQSAQTNEGNGLRSKFNVAVIGIIDIEGQNGSVGQLPYGKKGSAFYIAGTILEKIPGKLLTVEVSAGPNPDLLTFTGSWVYVTGGNEIKVNVSDATNRFKICWGDYIKSCTIQRTSTNSLNTPGFTGWFYFQILEGGTNIFESPQMTNEEPVIYERK